MSDAGTEKAWSEKRRETTTAHHFSCIAEQAWDIPEAYDHCSCPPLWPRKVCIECWNQPHQHRRDCSRHPKAALLPALEAR